MKRARVILADDHTLALDALKKLLEPEFEVVGIFDDGWLFVGGCSGTTSRRRCVRRSHAIAEWLECR